MKIIVLVISLGAVLAFGSTSATAQPTYLACALDLDGKLEPINFTTDEQIGTVSIQIVRSGSSRTLNATFTADKVIIDERDVRWEISRTDLSFSRTIPFLNSITSGQCTIQATPQRAF